MFVISVCKPSTFILPRMVGSIDSNNYAISSSDGTVSETLPWPTFNKSELQNNSLNCWSDNW